MKLTKNSWHYNAYLFLTGKTPNNNFCDYFWELLFNLIFFIPNLPFYLSMLIYSKFEDNPKWAYNEITARYEHIQKTYKEKLLINNNILFIGKLFLSILGYFLIALIIILILMGIKHPMDVLKALGLVASVIIIAVGAVYFFTESTTKDKIIDNVSEIKDIAVEGFKSFKNNYCPKIDWKE